MAIQVSSTTVIDNSRNLNNIAGADATTVSSLESAGLGGASTTFGDVGTYVIGRPLNTTAYNAGATVSGVSQKGLAVGYDTPGPRYFNGSLNGLGTQSNLSGTWRCMTNAGFATIYGMAGLWVRIS